MYQPLGYITKIAASWLPTLPRGQSVIPRMLCLQCRGAFMQAAKLLQFNYPGMEVVGSTYPVPLMKVHTIRSATLLPLLLPNRARVCVCLQLVCLCASAFHVTSRRCSCLLAQVKSPCIRTQWLLTAQRQRTCRYHNCKTYRQLVKKRAASEFRFVKAICTVY